MVRGILRGIAVGVAVTCFHSGAARQKPLYRYEYAEIEMGVRASLTVYALDEATAKRACAAAFARIAELEDKLSDYRPDSELMRLCDRAGGQPVPISPELFTVLSQAQILSRRSGGAFDVTVGPYVRLWRAARQAKRLPSPEALRQAAALVGWRKLRLNAKDRTVWLLVRGMKLDLGGIAKGYAGDEALAMLKHLGVTRALFEAGGDIVAGDPPPGEQGWKVEIANVPRGKPKVWRLANAAISSSGDTEQYVEIGGKRYSHIVDPRTGVGLTDRIAVTVVARRGILTDGLSTALSVMGTKKGRALVKSYSGVSAYFRHDLKAR